MNRDDPEQRLYEAHAAVCKVFASPWRLRIVETLGEGEMSVSDLVQALGIPNSNLSQHLALMRDRGLLASRRDGTRVFYRLTNPKTLAACRLMREILLEQLQQAGELLGVNLPEVATSEPN